MSTPHAPPQREPAAQSHAAPSDPPAQPESNEQLRQHPLVKAALEAFDGEIKRVFPKN